MGIFSFQRLFGQKDGNGFHSEVILRHHHQSTKWIVCSPGVFQDEIVGSMLVLGYADDGHTVVVGGLMAFKLLLPMPGGDCNPLGPYCQSSSKGEARFADVTFPTDAMPPAHRFPDSLQKCINRDIHQ